MKWLIENIKQQLSESKQTDQIKIGWLKYEIRKSEITNSKKTSQIAKRSRSQSEKKNKLKTRESNLNSEENFNEHTKCKNDIELIYNKNGEGVKIRSKC